MQRDKVLSLIGLAMKAGKCASGEFMTEREAKTGGAKLVMVAADASDNTKKMFTDMCTYYKVPLYFWGKKEDLGAAIGRDYRASVALTDAGFRDAVVKQIESE